MAKWFKDYLSFGSRRSPPQPPKPDYTESDILKAYRAQKSLDFEDPYEDGEGKADPDPGGSPNKGGGGCSGNLEGKYGSPKHRLIKVDASDLNRSKALLATAGEDAAVPSDQVKCGFETRSPLPSTPVGVPGWFRPLREIIYKKRGFWFSALFSGSLGIDRSSGGICESFFLVARGWHGGGLASSTSHGRNSCAKIGIVM